MKYEKSQSSMRDGDSRERGMNGLLHVLELWEIHSVTRVQFFQMFEEKC